MSKKVKTIISMLVLTGVLTVGAISTTLPVRANASTVETSTATTTVTVQKTVTTNGYKFNLNSDGTATVTGVDNTNTSTTLTIPSSVTVNSVKYTVTAIYSSAFSGSCAINIVLPDSVTSLGDQVFINCYNLKYVTLPRNLTAIGRDTFLWCRSLLSVTLPDTLTTIGSSTFNDCSSLNYVKLPSNLTSIPDSTFSGCTALTSVDIPNSVTSIWSSAFYECSSLNSVILPSNLTIIGSSAFNSCSSLTSIDLPDTLTEIQAGAFYSSGLTSLNIPKNVRVIGSNTFSLCPLSYIIVSSLNQNYASSNGVLFDKNLTRLITYPIGSAYTTYTVPSSVTEVSENAFNGSKNLVNLQLSINTQTLDLHSISNCTALSSLYLPDYVKYFDGSYVCSGDLSLKKFVTSDNNENYYTDDAGVLYSKNNPTLLAFPQDYASDSYEVPSTTTSVLDISGVAALKTLTISDGVSTIRSIEDCKNLETIRLPKTLTNFYGVLSNLPSLKTVIVNNDFSYSRVKSLVGPNVSVVYESDLATSTPTAATTTEVSTSTATTTEVPNATSTTTTPVDVTATATPTTTEVSTSTATATSTVTPADDSTTTSTSTATSVVSTSTATTTSVNSTSTATSTETSQPSKTGDVSSLPLVLASLAGISGVGVLKRKK